MQKWFINLAGANPIYSNVSCCLGWVNRLQKSLCQIEGKSLSLYPLEIRHRSPVWMRRLEDGGPTGHFRGNACWEQKWGGVPSMFRMIRVWDQHTFDMAVFGVKMINPFGLCQCFSKVRESWEIHLQMILMEVWRFFSFSSTSWSITREPGSSWGWKFWDLFFPQIQLWASCLLKLWVVVWDEHDNEHLGKQPKQGC